jgi:hypothetical protein
MHHRGISDADTFGRPRTCVRSESCGSQGSRSADRAALHPAASLREAEQIDTPDLLEGAYDREARIVALDIPDREAILRVLEDCPEEMLELRPTLLQEHVWRHREGLV